LAVTTFGKPPMTGGIVLGKSIGTKEKREIEERRNYK
jgi:hypothetical protein